MAESDGKLWSRETTMQFIDLVKTNYPKFNTTLKKNVWGQIASALSAAVHKPISAVNCDYK